MKVLFVTSWYPSSSNALKGIFVKKHAQAIHMAGTNIQVLALSVNHSKKLFEKKVRHFTDEKGLDTHIVELNSRFYKFIHLHIWYQHRVLRQYYTKNIRPYFKPQVVNSVVLYPAGILGHRLARKENCPHVIIEHWSKVGRFMKKSLFAAAGRKAYGHAKKIVVVSQYAKSMLTPYVKDPGKLAVIPNVINTEMFHPSQQAVAGTPIVFACVAHWTVPKRPDLIFESLQNLATLHKKTILLHVVGEGVFLRQLKARSWDFAIQYHGSLPPEKVAGIFRSSHYFLHASDVETFSVVIAEALASGLPVLASEAGAIPELISSNNGLVCKNTVEAWTQGLLSLLGKNDYDPASIATQACERFNEAHIGQAFTAVYNQAVLQSNPR